MWILVCLQAITLWCATLQPTSAAYVRIFEQNTIRENLSQGEMVLDILKLRTVKMFMTHMNSTITECKLLSTKNAFAGDLYNLSSCRLYPGITDIEQQCPNVQRYAGRECKIKTLIKLITDPRGPETSLVIETNVENVNEAPVFHFRSSTNLGISNSVPYRRPFLHGQAIDPDGRSNEVFFGMDGGDGKFRIEKVPLNTHSIRMEMYSDSFFLSRVGTLNRTEKPEYLLTLKAWDDGTPPRTGSATVTIRVNQF